MRTRDRSSLTLFVLAAAVAGCATARAAAATSPDGALEIPAPIRPGMQAKRPPPRGPDGPISPAQRAATIETLLKILAEKYVFPERANKARSEIRSRMKRGEYDALTTGHALATRLTEHLEASLHDAHMFVGYSAAELPVREAIDKPSAEELGRWAVTERRVNGGFERVERLPGNIGYIEVRSFAFTRRGYDAAAAAMAFVADTDALIIDLRRNGGGDPDMVAALCSYLFAESVHLNDLYYREGDVTRQYWTLPGVPGRRYVDKPVHVLTSSRTGSGAEEFSYDLQQLKRATIVGEVTWGGANPGDMIRIGDHFEAFIPTGTAINPLTKTNWEGTGVKPDIATTADDALRVAQVKLLEGILEDEKDPELRRELETRLRELAPTP